MDSQILGKTQDHHFILGDAIQLGPNSVHTHQFLSILIVLQDMLSGT